MKEEPVPFEALRTILSAGNIPATDEAAVRLWKGIGGADDRRGLRSLALELRVLRFAKATPTVLATVETVERVETLARELAEILDHDLTAAGCELNVAFGAYRADTKKILAGLRSLEAAAGLLSSTIHLDDRKQRPRGPAAETQLFVDLFRGYCHLSGRTALGIGGPHYRFTVACVKFLNSFNALAIEMPSAEALHQRVKTSLKE
jgi:hypothetical protein